MIKPYWYQADCLRAIRRAFEKGRKEVLFVLASGLGKTVALAFHILEYLQSHPDGRILVLAHKTEILEQIRITFEVILGMERSYGMFTGGEKSKGRPQILFAMFQSMRGHKELFSPDDFDCVAIDESHHVYAETYLDVVEYFKAKRKVAMTATPDRTDGQDITKLFGNPVFYLPLEEALAQDLLSPVDYRLMTDEIKLPKLSETPHRVTMKSLNKLVFVRKRDEEIAKIIAKNLKGIQNPRTIIFCESIAYCEYFSRLVPQSMPYHSRVSAEERIVRLEMFRSGMIPTLLTVDVLNEGVDIPQANALVFLRSTSSPIVLLQQLGRGLRVSDEKDRVVVLDFVANCERVKTICELVEEVKKRREKFLARKPRQITARAGRTAGAGKAKIEPLVVDGGQTEFKEKVVKLVDLINRINTPFYSTWEEASVSAIALGITSKEDYAKKYVKDVRLPSSPMYTYENFPGWRVFLGGKDPDFYTYKQACRVVQKMGITTGPQYQERKGEDERLPGDPPSVYKDEWEGWPVFFGAEPRNFVRSIREASAIAREAGVKTKEEYLALCDRDSRLPRDPWTAFENFPGWPAFLKQKSRRFKSNPYPTWQAAARAAKKLGVTSCASYQKLRHKDPRLYADPIRVYKDCPDWNTFLGKS